MASAPAVATSPQIHQRAGLGSPTNCSGQMSNNHYPTRWTGPPTSNGKYPSFYRALHVVVSVCQEDLSWLSCDWHPRMRVHIFRKCSPSSPGTRKSLLSEDRRLPRRFNHTTDLVKEWAPGKIPALSCATYYDGPTLGWESMAYLTYIASRFESIDPLALYAFMQGSGPDEFFRWGPLRNLTMATALSRVMAANATFSTLTGLLSRTGNCRVDFGPVYDYILRGTWQGTQQHLGCEDGYIRPVRGQFAVAGQSILQHGIAFWKLCLTIATRRATRYRVAAADGVFVQLDRNEDFENAWSTIFGCRHSLTLQCLPTRQAHLFRWRSAEFRSYSFAAGSFDCYAS